MRFIKYHTLNKGKKYFLPLFLIIKTTQDSDMKNKSMTDAQRKKISRSLKKAKKLLNCKTDYEFAKILGICHSTPGFWNRGESGVSIPIAKKIQKMTKGKVTIFDLVPTFHELLKIKK